MGISLWKDIVVPIICSALIGTWLYYKGQRDKAVEDLISLVNLMASKGIEYWNTEQSDNRSTILASLIKQHSAHIGKDLEYLIQTYRSFRFPKNSYYLLTSFRKSITDSKFEVSSRTIERHREAMIERRRSDFVQAVRDAKKLI